MALLPQWLLEPHLARSKWSFVVVVILLCFGILFGLFHCEDLIQEVELKIVRVGL